MEESAGYPASPAQQRFWLLEQSSMGPGYNSPLAVLLEGDLDAASLERSVREIVRRHEVLRTVFVSIGGRLLQRVRPVDFVSWSAVDLGGVPDAGRQQAADDLRTRESRRRFDLARDPPLRSMLVRLGAREHLLLLTLHHSVSDGWSEQLFWTELQQLYDAYRLGAASPLVEPPIQYRDYAERQLARVKAGGFDTHRRYWTQQLAGLPPVLELPTDYRRGASQTFNGASVTESLPSGLCDAIQAFARRERASVFMVLATAFALLLQRATGRDDVVAGSPVAERDRLDVEGLIGPLVNTVALRTDLSGDPTAREALVRVRRTCLDAFEHQALPFETLVEALHPARSSNHPPLVQVMLGLYQPVAPGEFGGLRTTPIEADTGTAKFDLSLDMLQHGTRLRARWEYNRDLFARASIERTHAYFVRLLQGIVAQPDERISTLPLVEAGDLRRAVAEWNDTGAGDAPAACVHDEFASQARQTPGASAARFGAAHISYGELDARSNQLARYLRARGAGPEVPVAILLDRSLDAVVAMLAVLKAGGAYVPLDPADPRERLVFVLADSGAPLCITTNQRRGALQGTAARAVLLDGDQDAIGREDPDGLKSGAQPETLAYVMYTSGSTGRPKGVAVPHRAVHRLVCGTDYAPIASSDVVAQASTMSFDAATFEIWGALLNGACLLGVPTDVVLSPRALADAIRRHGITTMFLTTALFNQIARTAPHAFEGLDRLLFGGEAADPQRVRDVLLSKGPARLIHVYGPTETTTFASWHVVERVGPEDRTVPIGRPVKHTRLYVCDANLQSVPIGMPGTLYIGGDGLARGYHNQPGLTAERFVPDPFSGAPGGRLYNTGDRVRRLPDGTLEFLHRLDDQVKVRGFRVEPAEIVSALQQHDRVSQAAVIARDDREGLKQLVAYVVPRNGTSPDSADLRRFLESKLPSYAVPAHVVTVDALPLSANGKLDRAALPDPAAAGPARERPPAGSGTPTERRLAAMWESLLGVQPASATDNFFDLGGHSLLALRLMADVEDVFGCRIPIAVFFQAPAIGRLAAAIDARVQSDASRTIVLLRDGARRPPFFWLHGDGATGQSAQDIAPDRPLYGFTHEGLDGRPARFTTVETLAAHYLAEIRDAQPFGPYVLGGYSFGGMVAYEVARQLAEDGQTVGLLALLEPTCPAGIMSPEEQAAVHAIGSREPLADRIGRHRENLARRAPLGRLGYIGSRIAVASLNGARLAAHAAAAFAKTQTCRVCFAAGRRLPVSLRRTHILEIYRRAALGYVPHAYSQPAVLFRTASYGRAFESSGLFEGGVRLHDLPGDHQTIVTGRARDAFVDALRVYLDHAL